MLSESSQQLTHSTHWSVPFGTRSELSSDHVLCQWRKPMTGRALGAFRGLPALSAPLEKTCQEEKLHWDNSTVQCKAAEERTPMQQLLAASSAAQLMRDIFLSSLEDRMSGP